VTLFEVAHGAIPVKQTEKNGGCLRRGGQKVCPMGHESDHGAIIRAAGLDRRLWSLLGNASGISREDSGVSSNVALSAFLV
jgi:hypothetical protein